MNILFITDLYPIFQDEDTIPKTLKQFVDKWRAFGHNVVVIRPNLIPNVWVRSRKIKPEGVYDVDGVKVYNKNYWLANFGNISFLQERDFDVIVAHMPTGILFAQKIKKQLQIPLITGVHASDITVLTDWKYAKFFRTRLTEAFLEADVMALRSYWLKDRVEQIIPKLMVRAFVAYSGVEEKYILPENIMLKKFKNWENKPVYRFVTAASFIKRKNINLIIKALSLVKNKNWELEIIGKGKLEKPLKKLVQELGLENRIKFIGHIPRAQVFEHFRNADVFLLPSLNETFGLVYFEAMASGCITLCAKDSGVDGILIDGVNGFVAPATLEKIHHAITSILNLSQEQVDSIISKTHETIIQYTSDKAAQNYIDKINPYHKQTP